MSGSVGKGEEREDALKLLLGRICCVVGLLLSAGGFVVALLGASVNVSAGAVGAALGILVYLHTAQCFSDAGYLPDRDPT